MNLPDRTAEAIAPFMFQAISTGDRSRARQEQEQEQEEEQEEEHKKEQASPCTRGFLN